MVPTLVGLLAASPVGTAYTFEIRGKDGIRYTPTSTATATTPASTAPQNLTATPASTQVTLAWTAPASGTPTGYQYRYKTSGGSYLDNWADTLGRTSTLSQTITSLTNNTLYNFQVRAKIDSGSGTEATVNSTPNNPPTFSSSATASVNEGTTAVVTLAAADTDTDDNTFTYSIFGGADSDQFSLSGTALTFSTAPDFENPTDVASTTPQSDAENNVYIVIVRTTSGSGDREISTSQTLTITVADTDEAPEAPAVPTLASRTSTTLTLNWTAPTNAGPPITDYDYRYRAGNAGAWNIIDDATSTTLTSTITTLTASTSYQVGIRATNDEGDSDWSTSTSFTTLADTPSAPQNLTAQAGNNQVTLAWTAPASGTPTGYEYRYKSSGAYGNWTPATSPKIIATLTNDTPHTFEVRAKSDSGPGETLTISATPLAPPSAPQNLTATPASNQVTLAWTAPASGTPTGYQYRQKTSGGSYLDDWADTSGGISTLNQTITSLTNNTTYNFQVRAKSDSGPSTEATVNSTPNTPPAFSSFDTGSVTEGITAVTTLSATDTDSADTTTVTYSIVGGADSDQFSLSAAALSFKTAPDFETPTDVASISPQSDAENNVYIVIVRATSGSGDREITTDQTLTITVVDVDPDVPEVTTILSVVTSTTTTLSWATVNPGPPITDYDYRYRAGNSGNWTTPTATTDISRVVIITGLIPSTSYQVSARATNKEGTGDWSTSVPFTTSANSYPIIISAATVNINENAGTVVDVDATDADVVDTTVTYSIVAGADSAKFSINSSSGALSFKTAPDFENPTDVASTNPQSNAKDNVYIVTVKATSGKDSRLLSSTQDISVTVLDVDEPPSAPNFLNLVSSSSGVLTLSWQVPDSVDDPISSSDILYKKTSANNSWTAIRNPSVTLSDDGTIISYVFPANTLEFNTAYDISVRITSDEGTSPWSPVFKQLLINNPAVFYFGPTLAVNENERTATTISARDHDPEDTQIRYSIVSGVYKDRLVYEEDKFTIDPGTGEFSVPETPLSNNDGGVVGDYKDDKDKFTIDPVSGELTFVETPDYENPASTLLTNVYNIIVRATSGTGARQLHSDRYLTIEVKNVVEAANFRDFPANGQVRLTWEVPANTAESYQYRYKESITANYPTSWTDVKPTFGLSSSVMEIVVDNLTNGTTYNFQIRAKNETAYSPIVSISSTPTPILFLKTAFEAPENSSWAAVFQISDRRSLDETFTSTSRYTLQPGGDGDKFDLNPATGALVFKTTPDYENPQDRNADNIYIVTIRGISTLTTESNRLLSEQKDQIITIEVTNVHESPKPPTGLVAEAGDREVILSWQAPTGNVEDITGYQYRYRESSRNEWPSNTWINISGGSTVFTWTIGSLTNGTTYDFQIRAKSGLLVGYITPKVRSIPNIPPVFTSGTEFTPLENQFVVGTISATDLADSVTYTITGGADKDQFVLNPTNGKLNFFYLPDYENPQDKNNAKPSSIAKDNEYIIKIRATSGTGLRRISVDQTLTITVKNVAETPLPPRNLTLTTKSTQVTLSWQAPASNTKDAIEGYQYSYRKRGVVDHTPDDWTDVTGNNQLTQVIEVPEFLVVYGFQIRSKSDSGYSTPLYIATYISADDNNNPRFTSPLTFRILENNSLVGTVSAEDTDIPDNIVGYSIIGGEDQEKFNINQTTGVLTFKTAPNYEKPTDIDRDNVYKVDIRSTSGSTARRKSTTRTFNIEVLNDKAGPSSPSGPIITTATTTTLTLAWTAPTDTGVEVLSYGYRYRLAGSAGPVKAGSEKTSWTLIESSSTDRTTTFKGLKPGTLYEIAVRATGGEGSGPWSTTSTTATLSISPALVGNTQQPTRSKELGQAYGHAQAFTTGSNTGGYTLTGIGVYLIADDEPRSSEFPLMLPTATLREGSLSGSIVATLTKPTYFVDNAINTWTAPANTDLKPATTYYLILAGGAEIIRLWTTVSDNEDSGKASGWSIGNLGYDKLNASSSFAPRATGTSFKINVVGRAKAIAGNSAPTFSSSHYLHYQRKCKRGRHSVGRRCRRRPGQPHCLRHYRRS